MLKIASVLMFLAVPFLALGDAGVLFFYRCKEGFSLAVALWNDA